MAFRTLHQISSLFSYTKSKYRANTFNRRRNYACKTSKIQEVKSPCPDTTGTCPNKSCTKEVVKKEPFWACLLGMSSDKPKPPIASCRRKQAECKTDPDLSEFGGEAFRTCGTAYIIQKDMLPSEPCVESNENKAIRKMEAELEQKNNIKDPMPSFTSVEQRMIDLNEKRLHPYYKCYLNRAKRPKALPQRPLYKTRCSGPIEAHEIPIQLKFNRDLLEKKNLFADYKRVEPPRQLVARMVEMKKNARPTMEQKKVPVVPTDAKELNVRQRVFDTLYQKETKF